MASFTLLEHTADIGISAQGETQAELFVSAAQALCRILSPSRHHWENQQTRSVSLAEETPDVLLVTWLQEVLFLVEAEHFFPADIAIKQISETSLSATLSGQVFTAPPPALREVKAVTFHRLAVTREPDGWQATVFLDL